MLNPEQKKAVETVDGRILILAGAGSGKTRVIVHRIAYLVGKKNICPEAILGMTFTNKAATEMRHRIGELIPPSMAKKVTLCTFHSFCMQILRKEIHRLGYTKEFSLYDEQDMRRLTDQISKEAATENELTPEERIASSLRAYNAVNFDRLITLTIQLFEKHPDFLEQIHNQYRYIMIDEYQDTNEDQMRLTELLASKHHNLCVVGDDDQSIYGWRGAEIKNIIHFPADKTITLEQNYRSTSTILSAANAVIQHNKNRHPKKLWSAIPSTTSIEIFHAQTDIEEAEAVAMRILDFRETQGWKWSDIAVLYRSNSLSRSLESVLMQTSYLHKGQYFRGIPYEIYGGLAFAERAEIKDVFAYLRFIANPKDSEALLRIINVPRRGISNAFLDQITQYNRSLHISLYEAMQNIANQKIAIGTPRAQEALRSFLSLIDRYRSRFAKEPLKDALTAFLEEIHYHQMILDEVKNPTAQHWKWENVQECIHSLSQYEEEQKKQNEKSSLQHFVSNSTLSIFPKAEERVHDKLQVMTLHSAKGLEFKACFIVGLEDHILPHEKSLLETGVEEERRLFYVGITRAMSHLILSMARSRMQNGKYVPTKPSRFLFEIPKELTRITTAKAFR